MIFTIYFLEGRRQRQVRYMDIYKRISVKQDSSIIPAGSDIAQVEPAKFRVIGIEFLFILPDRPLHFWKLL